MLTEHEIEIRVRYSETDSMGYLHHGNYFSYFEMGRTELFRAQGGNYRVMEESGTYFVVVKIQCKYQAPARYDDVLTLKTVLKKRTAVRLEHEYTLSREGKVLCVAEITLACVDAQGNIRPIPIIPGIYE